MSENQEKRSFKTNLKMILDTIKILYQLSPRMMIVSEVGAVFKSFTPFVNIYMSARIIDELAGARSASRRAGDFREGDSLAVTKMLLLKTLTQTVLLSTS